MHDVMNEVLNKVWKHEYSIKRQNRTNKCVRLCLASILVNLTVSMFAITSQQKEIESLINAIEEMKKTKGE